MGTDKLNSKDKLDDNNSVKFDKNCEECFINGNHKNSDIKAAVQNLSCSLNLLSNSKCNKCSNFPDYVPQLSNSTISSSDHHSLKTNNHNVHTHQLNQLNGNLLTNNHLNNSNEHNIEIPDNQIQRPNPIFSALKGVLLAFLSSIFFSLTTVIVKYVKEIDAGQMV